MLSSKLEATFLNVIQQLYFDSTYFISPLLRPWSPADANTGSANFLYIGITGVQTVLGAANSGSEQQTVAYQMNRLPAILVDLGDLSFDPDSNSSVNRLQSINMETGEYQYSNRVIGSVQFIHKAGSKSDARLYADNTAELLSTFSQPIRRAIGLERLALRAILKPTQRKEAPEEWDCRVQADFQYQDTFILQSEAPKLKQVSIVTGLPDQNINMTQ